MRKRFFKIILVLGICLSIGLVLGQRSPSLAAEKPIVIGGSLPLTGTFSATGKWVEKGYQYWADEVNAKGGILGRPVKLVIYDDKSDAKEAVSLAEKVITVDKVDLLLGGYPGTACTAVMPVVEKYKMVYVSMGGHMRSFSQGYAYSFGSPPLMGEWWYLGFFEWMKTVPVDKHPKKAAVFTMNNPIGMSLMDSLYKGCKELGIEIVIDEKYNLPLTTADTMITKAKQMKADILFANGMFPDGVMTLRACKAIDYSPKAIVQGIGSVIPEWTKELGKDGDFVFSGTSWHYKLKYPGNDKIIKAAKEKFKEDEPPLYFGFGYAWMQTLQQGVGGAKSLDQMKIRDWLKTNEVKTIAGNFKFDEKGLPKPFVYLTQVISGNVELIWPPDMRTHEPVYTKPAWK
ncbi:MAG: amino acid ABC transporter substrate-binding protein [Thermodesulfobacteriota bacterium]|nr:amino acid ABC transporter substrate-binding protein [Thermodesulfobacteriota bacterium]